MWVITTRLRASGSVPASMSRWPGLPPQSTSTASLPATKSIEVASRSRPGRAPEREGHADDAGDLGDPNGPEHERVRAESLGDEAADRVEPEVGQEQRARRPLEPLAEEADEEDEDQKVPQRLVEKG